MTLDPQSSRNLELYRGGRWGASDPSLLSTLDFTRTSMGARLLRRWVGQPLLELAELERRQDATALLHADLLKRQEIRGTLSKMSDLERIMSRVRLGKAVPRDLLALKESLIGASHLLTLLQEDSDALDWLKSQIRPFDDLAGLVERAVMEEPAGSPGEGGVIKEGFSEDLDELRSGVSEARRFIAGLERQEKEATGIRSLKVGYNRVFGYYIEVRKANLAQVPDTYVRRQTLTNGERFITPELKKYEALVLERSRAYPRAGAGPL